MDDKKQKAIKYYNAKLARLKKIRTSYEPTWADILDNIAPDLKGYLNTENNDRGEREDQLIYDTAPTDYWQKCAAGLFASISSPSRPWAQRTMANDEDNEIPGIRAWLDDVTAKDRSIYHQSNFYRGAFSMYAQLSAVGVAVKIFEPDYDNIIHCTVLNVGEYWLGINGKGLVDTLFREITYSAGKLQELFGEENLPASVNLSITDTNPDGSDYKVIHVIAPDTQKLAPFKKPWLSMYYMNDKFGDKQIIDIKGYKQKPFAAPRWYANNNETYAKMYPGRNALGNCKQLQKMIYDFMCALELEVRPPMQGPPMAGDFQGLISAIPGAYNAIASGTPDATIKRLFETNPQFEVLWQAISDKKQQIESQFYNDLFMPIMSNIEKEMTATEVNQISGEKMVALGAALENFHTEYLNVSQNIEFSYATEAGVYPNIGDYVTEDDYHKLQGQDIKTEYVSILAQAQKYTDASKITSTLQLAEMCGQLDPTGQCLQKLDLSATIAEGAKLYGAPGKMIRSDEQLQKMAEAQQQQEQMQQMMQGASTAADVAQKAGSIPMDTDNALTRMLGVQ